MGFLAAGTFVGRQSVPCWAEIEGNAVVAAGTGEPPGQPDVIGWLLPRPVNAHTHIADSFLRELPKPRSVKELVGPGGWKHQQLANAPPDAQDEGAARLAEEMAGVGTATFLDFREGGLAGVEWLRGLDLDVAPTILGRPSGTDEPDDVVAAGDGVGLPGMRDMKMRDIEAWAEAAHDARKPFAVHVSEDKRDDIDAVLALEPAFVVHMVRATRRDLEACAEAGVHVAVCPRSNAWFGLRPPVATMLEEGIQVCLGTDNGMIASGDLLDEARALHQLGVPVEECLRAMAAGRALVGLPWRPPQPGDTDLVILPQDILAGRTKPTLGVNPEFE